MGAKKKVKDTKKMVNIEVSVKPDGDALSVYDQDTYPSTKNIDDFRAHKGRSIELARKLAKNNFTVHHVGDFSISAACPAEQFESFFKTKISDQKPDEPKLAPEGYMIHAPLSGADWEIPKADGLSNLIERAYIQQDPIFMSDERELPPFWNDKFRLRVPVDVAQIMGASSVHRMGLTGNGVKVAMPDSGFYHHPYFIEQGYNFLSVTAPDALDHTTDSSGHGTGECANLFATAPEVNFIGVKMNNPTLAFKTAVDFMPDIMTNSWGYSVDMPGTSMPNWLRPLYLAVLDAVSKGITVCFSAGNGHFAFPGSIPEVISVGGVHVDGDLNYTVSDYTSGFSSTWFPGRETPDISGLCGMRPTADYIVLPVEDGASLEKEDGWGAFSGTSASSPMVAGVCALLKQADQELSPENIKNLLKFTAQDITTGTNAHGRAATPGPDGATGFGLVNAERAINAIV